MRMLLLFLTLFFADLSASATDYPPTYYIPAAGSSTSLGYFDIASQTFYVTTSGSVNLGSNTYTLTYASLPSANTTWNVIFDATSLTVATNTNVNLFGETPLSTYYPIKKFYINFSVVWDAGVPSKKVTYFGSLADLKTFTQSVTFSGTSTFNGRANFNDSAEFYGSTWLKPASPITTGQTVVSSDTLGKLTYGCVPWCITGNAGTVAGTNFLGTTDAVDLVFKVNSNAVGRLTASSIFFGNSSYSGFSGSNNVAIGDQALANNASADGNTGIGAQSLYAVTSGDDNTGLGRGSGSNITSGLNNIAIGTDVLGSLETGNSNIGIGRQANVAGATTEKSIEIGYQAIAGDYGIALGNVTAANNTLAFYPRSIYAPNATNSIRYVWTDTSGSGNFIPQPLPNYAATTFTPVTGDSITVSTSQNDINPAGTLAVLTVILPGSPYSGQILEFSTTQVLTSLLWSIRLSGGTTAGLPSSLAQYGTVKIKWNSTLSKWLNY